jgi:hypothetical protein
MFGDPSFGIGLGIKLAELTRWVVWPRYLDAPIARVNDRHYHWEIIAHATEYARLLPQ